MRKQDHLTKLIATLNPAEKRYFKQFSNIQPGEKRYMQLLDALENTPQYDAVALMKKLNLDSKQLRDDKYYLMQSLLKCLRNYEQIHVNLPVQRQVEISRSEMSILMGRGLWDVALEMADKAFAIALESEMFDMAGNLMAVKYVCSFNLQQFEELDEKFFDERERIAKIIDQNRHLLRLNATVAKTERQRKGYKELDKVLAHELLKKKPTEILSLTGQVAWFEIKLKYYVLKDDQAKALEVALLQWKHFDSHKTVRRLNPTIWIKSYTDLAHAELAAGNGNKAIEYLNRLNSILDNPKPVLSKVAMLKWKDHAYLSTMVAHYTLGRFNEVIRQAEATDTPIANSSAYEQFLFLFYYSLALMHVRESDTAILKLNELLQLNAEVLADLQVYIRPALVLCQLDAGNFQVVPYLIKSGKAWMKRQKNETPEMNLFFSLTYSIAKAPAAQRPACRAKLREAVKANKLPALNKHLLLTRWFEEQ